MFDTERFIGEIEKRPALFDVTSDEYGNRDVTIQCWNDIAEIVLDDWHELSSDERILRGNELKKKWKAIRDAYVKEHRRQVFGKAGKRRRYIYAKQLEFLIPFIRDVKDSGSTVPLPFPCKAELSDETSEEACHDAIEEAKSAKDTPGLEGLLSYDNRNDPAATEISGKLAADNFQPPATDNVLLNTTSILARLLSDKISVQSVENSSDRFGNRAFLLSFLPLMDGLPPQLNLDARMKVLQVFQEITANGASTLNFQNGIL